MRLAKRALQISPSPTLAIDAQAKKMIAEGINVLNFGVGEPDFDTPDYIKEAGIAAIKQGFTKYTPVAGTEDLRKAIAAKLKADNGLEYQLNEIVVSAGAKHSLYNAIQVLCDEGDEVILPAPYWVSYIEQIKLAGGIPKIIYAQEANGFKLTPEELDSAITPRTRVLILNSPSNPTGTVYSRAELEALGRVIEAKEIYVISDEIYEKLLYDGLEHVSIASLSSRLKELAVVINGVSKAYAMTGWRIGYTASQARIAKAMADLQSHSTSNATSIAQKASAVAITGSQEPLARMLLQFEKRRDYMLERLQAMDGVTCTKPGGAFYLFPNISSFFGK
ncbi:MAG: pyridoxal phosphate-dependent aminotransferase, partial [Clostridia bacterium]|nr:pyridoxal phosphate-dependent aminotransferase [Clostridia bacterium]